jgi:hypothetical protein
LLSEGCGVTKAEAVTRMNHYIRLYSRLESAVSKHEQSKAGLFADDADDALHAAWRRIMKSAAKGPE